MCFLLVQFPGIGRIGTLFIYEEKFTEVAGSLFVKAEILVGSGRNGGGSSRFLILTVYHNCEGQRQIIFYLPPSYFNQSIVAIKIFDLGTINLEARFSGERGIGSLSPLL
ncbi:hypothetical protein NECAME_00541 [Necator americanus]|uniref:Transthyretin-like family protein n=1 Tax=Necator americanus TaxID=51031 RepID=W2T4Q9_NECAM|nr:hypothetical protein NECAME_00541 [Necator americanus]ETN77015.1 hypothetical protein NECAME_00541 [Necator americanus]